ncbi:restriction endonuclease PLD domain-containing protein [Psychromonas arctica]|uniref:Restriction endonuclease PLD domain-containing protein n=1 Tax=Psychromonas arctica TaxID=168275 RepID=A0ABU9HBN8_9GAMM
MLVTNNNFGHLETINKMLSGAQKVYIAVAFLKSSGLTSVLTSIENVLINKGVVNLVIGLDLYITDAEALYVLYELKQKYKGVNLYLYKSKSSTFHPKIYSVRNAKTKSTLIGSANLTNGGLISNTEASFYTKNNDDLFDQVVSFYEEIITNSDCESASHLKIKAYEEECNIHNTEIEKATKKAKKIIHETLNSPLVMKYYKEYCSNPKEMDNLQQKRQNYKEAKKLVRKINSNNIKNKDDFISVYEKLVGAAGEGQLWHSGSIFRSKNIVAKSYKEFISFVEVATDKDILIQNPEQVFNKILPFKNSITGLGFNVITELLTTFKPSKFPVLNKNPIGSVKYLWGLEFKEPGSFKSNDYKSYAEFMSTLSKDIGAEDFIETDHFLNYVYWKYARNKT